MILDTIVYDSLFIESRSIAKGLRILNKQAWSQTSELLWMIYFQAWLTALTEGGSFCHKVLLLMWNSTSGVIDTIFRQS